MEPLFFFEVQLCIIILIFKENHVFDILINLCLGTSLLILWPLPRSRQASNSCRNIETYYYIHVSLYTCACTVYTYTYIYMKNPSSANRKKVQTLDSCFGLLALISRVQHNPSWHWQGFKYSLEAQNNCGL